MFLSDNVKQANPINTDIIVIYNVHIDILLYALSIKESGNRPQQFDCLTSQPSPLFTPSLHSLDPQPPFRVAMLHTTTLFASTPSFCSLFE